MQGVRGLDKGDFASMRDGLGYEARQSGKPGYTMGLVSDLTLGAKRDGKSNRKHMRTLLLAIAKEQDTDIGFTCGRDNPHLAVLNSR